MRFRSLHSRTDSSLAVQCQLRYATKPRKSRVNSHYRNDKNTSNISVLSRGGEGGIRTHGTVTRTTVFETALAQRAVVFGIGGFESPQPTFPA